MKVFVYSSAFSPDGRQVGIFATDQLKALKNIGVDVVGLAVDIRSIRRWRKWGLQKSNIEGIPIYTFSFPVGRAPLCVQQEVSSLFFEKLLPYVIKKEGKPDLVHAHFGLTGSTAVAGCKKNKLPLVITEHWSGVLNEKQRDKAFRYLDSAYRYASKLIVVSSYLGRVIKDSFGCDSVFIPNIVDTSIFSPETGRYCCSKNGFKFISIGNLIPGKGFDVLLSAAKGLISKYPYVSIDIVGDGSEYNHLKELIKENNLEEHVRLHGRLSRSAFAPMLSSSDCFVLASRFETFGVVYIEALASGVPVIATDCGGPTDIVDSTNGLIVPVDDVASLEKALLEMVSNASAYDRLMLSEQARMKYSPDVVANKLADVFSSVVGA